MSDPAQHNQVDTHSSFSNIITYEYCVCFNRRKSAVIYCIVLSFSGAQKTPFAIYRHYSKEQGEIALDIACK